MYVYVCKPSEKEDFTAAKPTSENTAYDKRKPSLFKVKWKGDVFVGLNSTFYCCWGTEGNKFNCKGISKKLNASEKEVNLNVLQTQKIQSGAREQRLDLRPSSHFRALVIFTPRGKSSKTVCPLFH